MSSTKSTILAELEALRREHYKCPGYIDELWYSCPQSPVVLESLEEGEVERPCDCGADGHNARLDKLIALIKEQP